MGQTSSCKCSGQDEEEVTLQQVPNDQYSGRIDAPSSVTHDCCIFRMYNDELMVIPNTRKTFKTDLRSLTDVDGDGVECGEIWNAVCMTSIVGQESRDHHGVMLQDGPNASGGDSSLPEGEVVTYLPPMPLGVPLEFHRVEYKWAQPSSAQSKPTHQQEERLGKCLKKFVHAMLTGVLVQLRLDAQEAAGTSEDQNIHAVLHLSQDLNLLLISVGGMERSVPMTSIRWARPPEKEDKGHSWFQPQEQDHFVVLRLAGGRFVRICFEEQNQAAFFGTCIRLLIKAAHAGSQDKVRVA